MQSRYPAGMVNAREPQWSPREAAIAYNCAFRHDIDGNSLYDVCVSDAALSSLQRLTSESTELGLRNPIWSPDGASLAFRHPDHGIVVANLHTGIEERYAEHYAVGTCAWSPDGQQIACSVSMGIALIALDSGEITFPRVPAESFEPQWAHHGTMVLYLHRRSSEPYQRDLFAVDLHTEESSRIANDVHTFAVANRGDAVVITRHDQAILAWVDLTTGEQVSLLKRFTDCGIQQVQSPQWSPDDTMIAFTATGAADGQRYGYVYSMNITTGTLYQHAAFERATALTMSGPTWSPDGRQLAVTFSTTDIDSAELTVVPVSFDSPISFPCLPS
ncbi:MAG: hypothetical protein HC828_00730 [Blastochloris sp.]|nr:hypothetical protein [Blastochloris sp.]